jgi:GntR family transcriptional regulator, N-acetylglucosamine utilization regulator
MASSTHLPALNLDKSSPVPLYHQLRSLLQQQIEHGELRADDRLPNEDFIAARYEVSKITVREALKMLAAAGYVRREQGRGTFVTIPRLAQGPRKLTCFSDEMKLRGLTASSRVLAAEVVSADSDLAQKLAIDSGASVFRLKRIRLADGEIMGIQTAHLPLERVPGIAELDFGSVSLYETLEARYGLKPAQARETHCAIALSRADAYQLGLEPGAPALSAERLSFLADGRPLEYVWSIMRGDRYQIVLNLTAL